MPPAPDRRRAPREKVFEVSILPAGGREHRVHLLDAGTEGVRAHCVHRFDQGQRVILQTPTGDRPARICWVDPDGKLGLRFT